MVWIWDVGAGALLLSLPGHQTGLESRNLVASRSADGSRIVTFIGDGLGRILNADTGRELLSIEFGIEIHASWSHDGRRIAVSDIEGNLKIYPACQSLEERAEYAQDCCVIHDLSPEERVQMGLP